MIRVLEHEHPLKLIDLREKLKESDDDDEEEEEEDFVTRETLFTCKRCGEEIIEYHKCYYKCIMGDSCVYHLHKCCAELPIMLEHISHPHPFTLCQIGWEFKCFNCRGIYDCYKVYYVCLESCSFSLCVKCVVQEDIRRFYHPSHPHPLVSLLTIPILCKCNACGKEHKGVFFQCTTCFDFAIHSDCIKLPQRLLIQTTNDIYHHTHPLTLLYAFPEKEVIEIQKQPPCRVCGDIFFFYEYWLYACEKCIYYTHVDCATSRRESFMSILSIDKGAPTVQNFKDSDYPLLLHLPFSDQTYSIPKHLFYKETSPTSNEVSPQRINHRHDLVLVDTGYIESLGGPTSSKISSFIMCHNPMKRIQLLCTACLRPIMEMPFYKCGDNQDESCNFAIHEWCTRLPTKVDNHPGHPQHALILMTNDWFFYVFACDVCGLPCNGYAYGCLTCNYYVDVSCAFIPEKITHKAHPCHLLSRVNEIPRKYSCVICRRRDILDFTLRKFLPEQMGFSCGNCDVYIHLRCALLFPQTIKHPYDKHPLRLSYLPIENHKSEYFCEICEHELNPLDCFYHCDECVQSMHSACAPLILCCETETYSYREDKIYIFLNVKFGDTSKTDSHPHPLTFAQGIETDGRCSQCLMKLQYNMIFKCAECESGIHYYCCEVV